VNSVSFDQDFEAEFKVSQASFESPKWMVFTKDVSLINERDEAGKCVVTKSCNDRNWWNREDRRRKSSTNGVLSDGFSLDIFLNKFPKKKGRKSSKFPTKAANHKLSLEKKFLFLKEKRLNRLEISNRFILESSLVNLVNQLFKVRGLPWLLKRTLAATCTTSAVGQRTTTNLILLKRLIQTPSQLDNTIEKPKAKRQTEIMTFEIPESKLP
jgi:hypothetical protein